jgi:site-specific DNA recombinase
MNTLACYLRVSTPGQSVPEKESLPQQEADGRAFAEGIGFLPRIYNEGDRSGLETERAQLDRLLTDIAAGKIQAVWIWDEKRFSRSVALGATLLDYLIKYKVRFFVGDRERDPNDSSTYSLLVIQFAFAQKDLTDIKKRLLMGRIAHTNKGRQKLVAVYGYNHTFDDKGNRIFVVNEEEAEIVRELFTKYDTLQTPLKALAFELNNRGIPTKLAGKSVKKRFKTESVPVSNLWHDKQIKNILSRILYTGFTYTWDKASIIPSVLYPAIIDRDLFDRVNSNLTVNTKRRNKNGINYTTHPLASLITCSDCGAPYFYGASGRKKTPQYYHRHMLQKEKDCPCQHKTLKISMEKVFEMCFYLVFSQLSEINGYVQKYIAETIDHNKDALDTKEHLTKQIAKIDKEISNLVEYIATGKSSKAVLEGMDSRETEKRSLQDKITEIDKSLERMKTEVDEISVRFSKEQLVRYRTIPDAEKRLLYRELIQYAFIVGHNLFLMFKNGKRFIIEIAKGKETQYKIGVYFRDAYSADPEIIMPGLNPDNMAEFRQGAIAYDYSTGKILKAKGDTKIYPALAKLLKERDNIRPVLPTANN